MRPLTVESVEEMIRDAMARGEWDQVAILALKMDELSAPRQAASLGGAAMWYAQAGLHVFQLQPSAKIPYPGTHGFEDATSELAVVDAWWRQRPTSNIGIATGWTVDVIDVDGPLGVLSWARTENLPPILGTVSTPRFGGTHLYVAATGAGNRAGMLPGLDYRGLGGYVVAPPSYVVEKAKGYEGPYRWRRQLDLSAAASGPSGPPPPVSPNREGQPEAAAQQGTCAVCGFGMVLIEAGQTTHPACDPTAATA